MKVKVRLHGVEEQIDVVRKGDHLVITRAGTSVLVRLLREEAHDLVLEVEPAAGVGQFPRRLIQAAGVALDGSRRQLWLEGQVITYERVVDRPSRATAPSATGDLAATIPAIVSQVLVGPGDEVAAGDKLVLLESMKMVIPIQAPYAGIVRAVNCVAGQSVEPGKMLVELEPAA